MPLTDQQEAGFEKMNGREINLRITFELTYIENLEKITLN